MLVNSLRAQTVEERGKSVTAATFCRRGGYALGVKSMSQDIHLTSSPLALKWFDEQAIFPQAMEDSREDSNVLPEEGAVD